MSRPQSLTEAQLRRLRRWKAARRELIRQLKALPSRAELAREFNCSERTVGRAMNDRPEKPAPRLTRLRELFA